LIDGQHDAEEMKGCGFGHDKKEIGVMTPNENQALVCAREERL
jgi:hypothetical protein